MSAPAILWASPLPPIRSGVADYAAEVLPELARLVDVQVLRPPGWDAPARAAWSRGLMFVSENDARASRRIPVLHLGNNPYHLWVAGWLRRRGGVVVLHDAVLHHLLVEEAAVDGEWTRFETDLARAHGSCGRALAEARRWGYHGRLDPFMFAARRVFLAHAHAVVVHNARAAMAVRAEVPGVPVRQVPLAVAKLAAGDRPGTRTRLDVGEGEILLAHIGFLTPAKGLSTVLRGVATLRRLGVPVKLVVVGEESGQEALGSEVEALGLGDLVRQWGWASRRDLGSIVAAADIGVVPRYPTAGETSAAALRFLAAGRPILVSGYGQFLEFPADAAMRLCPGPAGVADFVRHVTGLAGDPAALARAGGAAQRTWTEGGHDPKTAARRLAAALEDVAHGLAPRG